MKSLIIVILLTAGGMAYTEPYPDTLWTKVYGREYSQIPYGMNQTADGGFILVGSTTSASRNQEDFCVVKVDSLGRQVWFKDYGGRFPQVAYDVIETIDGGILIAGGYGCYLVKTDAEGNMQWSGQFSGKQFTEAAVVETPKGDYLVVGTVDNGNLWKKDMFLVKVSQSGELIWRRTYGGKLYDIAKDIISTNDGGYLLAGWTISPVEQGHRQSIWEIDAKGDTVWTISSQRYGDRYYILKVDINGDTVWTNRYGDGHARLEEVVLTEDGGFLLVGYDNWIDKKLGHSFQGNLVRINSAGEILWSHIDEDIKYYSVVLAADDGFVLVGTYNKRYSELRGNIAMVKIDDRGKEQWFRTYYGNRAVSVVKTPDSGYAILGRIIARVTHEGNFYLVRTGPDLKELPTWRDLGDEAFVIAPVRLDSSHLQLSVTYEIPTGGRVWISVVDSSNGWGVQVVNHVVRPGKYHLNWDASMLPSGNYDCWIGVWEPPSKSEIVLEEVREWIQEKIPLLRRRSGISNNPYGDADMVQCREFEVFNPNYRPMHCR